MILSSKNTSRVCVPIARRSKHWLEKSLCRCWVRFPLEAHIFQRLFFMRSKSYLGNIRFPFPILFFYVISTIILCFIYQGESRRLTEEMINSVDDLCRAFLFEFSTLYTARHNVQVKCTIILLGDFGTTTLFPGCSTDIIIQMFPQIRSRHRYF